MDGDYKRDERERERESEREREREREVGGRRERDYFTFTTELAPVVTSVLTKTSFPSVAAAQALAPRELTPHLRPTTSQRGPLPSRPQWQ